MKIEFHGFSCVTLSGKNATVVIDPFDQKSSGIRLTKRKGDIVLGNEDFPFHHAVSEVYPQDEKTPITVFDWPGEYEAKGVSVMAVPAFNAPKSEEEKGTKAERALIFLIEIDGFKVCHLSNLGHKLTNEMLENIGDIDVLLIPVGGKGKCLDSEKAHEVIEQIDPRLVIPMYYQLPESKIELGNLDDFLKEVGMKSASCEKVIKLKSRSELPQEHTDFTVLEKV